MSGYVGRHRKGPEHRMVFWQRYCMWHAACSCGGSGMGYDGALAMRAIGHRGDTSTVPEPPVGIHSPIGAAP